MRVSLIAIRGEKKRGITSNSSSNTHQIIIADDKNPFVEKIPSSVNETDTMKRVLWGHEPLIELFLREGSINSNFLVLLQGRVIRKTPVPSAFATRATQSIQNSA